MKNPIMLNFLRRLGMLPGSPRVCSIIMSATAVLAVVLVALVIRCASNTSESCHLRPVSGRNISLIPSADNHLLALGVVVLAWGNSTFDDSAPFPSVVPSHGRRLRGSLSVLYPKNLVPRSCSTRRRAPWVSPTPHVMTMCTARQRRVCVCVLGVCVCTCVCTCMSVCMCMLYFSQLANNSWQFRFDEYT